MTLIIIIINIAIAHLLTVDKKKFRIILTKKLIKISRKRGKIIYSYKDVNVDFLIMFKILSKLQELVSGKVKQNLFGEYKFCVTLKASFLSPKFLILP